MKTISNSKVLVMFGFVFVVALTASPRSMAATPIRSGASSEACTRIITIASTSNANITAHMGSLRTDFANRLSNITSKQTTIDQKIATARSATADKFDAKVNELKSKANLTQVQLNAIGLYSSNVKMAEITRERTVDIARATYRAALSGEIATHQNSLSTAATVFQTTVSNAFETAEATCGDGTATATLKASLKTARQTFASARESSKVKSNIQQLAQTREAAIKAADATFASSVSTYTSTLDAILK